MTGYNLLYMLVSKFQELHQMQAFTHSGMLFVLWRKLQTNAFRRHASMHLSSVCVCVLVRVRLCTCVGAFVCVSVCMNLCLSVFFCVCGIAPVCICVRICVIIYFCIYMWALLSEALCGVCERKQNKKS